MPHAFMIARTGVIGQVHATRLLDWTVTLTHPCLRLPPAAVIERGARSVCSIAAKPACLRAPLIGSGPLVIECSLLGLRRQAVRPLAAERAVVFMKARELGIEGTVLNRRAASIGAGRAASGLRRSSTLGACFENHIEWRLRGLADLGEATLGDR
jgi:hypothetical protein